MNHQAPPPSSGQTIHGHQTNFFGAVTQSGGILNTGVIHGNVVIPSPQPTLAVPPTPPPDFVGREQQLAHLAGLLTAGKSAAITALYGMGGIGKTALAQQLAERLRPDFSGGIFWADLALHGGSAETILRTWGAHCGADFSQELNQAVLSERLRGLLAMRQGTDGALLAVLDDVRREWLGAAQLLQKSLPAGTPLLLTTRDVDLAMALDAEVVRLDVLPEADAHDLLAVRVKPKEILTPAATVKALLQHLGYLPLAIRLAAGHVSKFARKPGFDLGRFVEEVAQRAVSLLDTPGGSGLAATFAISYDALSVEQQRIFRHCSVYSPALLTVEHMASLLDLETEAVENLLDELVMVALLDWNEISGSYLLHPLLRQYGYERLEGQERAIAVHRIAADHLQRLSNKRSLTPQEALEEVDQWEKAQEWESFVHRTIDLVYSLAGVGYWPEIEQHLIRAQVALTHLADESATLSAAMLWNNRGQIAYRQARWNDAINYCELALSLSEQSEDIHNIADTYNTLALVYRNKAEWNKAVELFTYALTIFKQLGNRYGLAQTCHNLGITHLAKGEWDKAITYLDQSIRIKEQVGDIHSIALSWIAIGGVHQSRGEWAKAIELHKQALAILAQVGDIYNMTSAYHNLSAIYKAKGEWVKALSYCEQTLVLLEQVGDTHSMAKVWITLGNIYQSQAEWAKAISYYEQALSTLAQVGDRHSIAQTLGNLGNVYADQGEWDKAVEFHEQAMAILTQVDDRYAIAQTWINLGGIYRVKGEWKKAIDYGEQALTMLKQVGDRPGMATAYKLLGIVYAAKDDWKKAIDYGEQALAIYKQMNDTHGIADILGNLGIIYTNKGQWNKAIEFHEQALAIYKPMGHTHDSAQILGNLGNVYYATGKLKKALAYYEQALATFEQVGDIPSIAQTYNNLGLLYRSQRKWKKAKSHFAQALAIKKQLGDRHGIAGTMTNMGLLLLDQQKRDEAKSLLAQACLIFDQMDAPEIDTVAQALVHACGSPETAEAYLAQICSDTLSDTSAQGKQGTSHTLSTPAL